MNGYGLAASIVQSITSLAWPAAVVATAWIFRKQIIDLLPRLHVKHKDTEVSFRLEKAEEAAEEIKALSEPQAEAAPPTPQEQARFDEIARLSPAAAMLELRREIEVALRDAAARANLKGDRASLASPRFLVRELNRAEAIDGNTSALLDDILAIGNAAAHERDFQLSLDEARRYRKLADVALFALDLVEQRNGPTGT